MPLTEYLPQDRLWAIAQGEILPDRTSGSAMLADISGFTPLTEGLQQALGRRRGAEELTGHINRVFSALIAGVERFGGSVIGFAGDAITCWFDQTGEMPAERATAAAFAMQAAMAAFNKIQLPDGRYTALHLKVAIASGPARRFVVGNPNIHLLDALAGATVERTSTGEYLAGPGEVLLDEATAEALGAGLHIGEWRQDPANGERFALAMEFKGSPLGTEVQSRKPELSDEDLQAWIPQMVIRRIQSGFETELRPCAVLFVRFRGIDYDQDEAAHQLDVFIRRLQTIVEGYEGVLMQLTIGDKGSYVHLNFGALTAHEDDARRAVRAAREILSATDLSLQLGISQGVMLVGAYGGETRKTYNALGDDVNLAARLMTTAAPGQILVSGNVHQATRQAFSFDPQPPLPMKGKAEPLPVFTVTGEKRQRAVQLQEPTYALPMVGRDREMAKVEACLDLAAAGQGQVIGIVAEAGLGKSRLVAEAIRAARSRGFTGFGGACQSDGLHTPYLVWKPIWQAFFDINPDMPERRLVRWLEAEIEDRAPERVQALPLLNAVLGLNLAENDFTRNLEPKVRQAMLHGLLQECLTSASREGPILIVVEDMHWIDPLSQELLEQLARSFTDSPICFLLAYRPPQPARMADERLEGLPGFTRIELQELDRQDAELAIRAKLAQLYPARSGAVPPDLFEKLMALSQGNPFYLEELLNYLRDRGYDPRDPADLENIKLPDSLHSLILSRIDQLSDRETTTLRAASIVGRLFKVRWLTGYYPELGDLPQVKADLDELRNLDITPLDTPEPELSYLFKHIVTHEVTYESLPFATRTELHERLARYLEEVYPENPPLEALAFHYGRGEDAAKALHYFTAAGDAAFKLFALEGALTNYSRALEWGEGGGAGPMEIIHLYQRRGRTLGLLLRHSEARENYQALEKLGVQREDDNLRLAGLSGLADVYWYGLSDHEKAWQISEEALDMARRLGNRRVEARCLWNRLNILQWTDPVQGLEYGENGLRIARELTGGPDPAYEDLDLLALILLDSTYPLLGTGQIDLARRRAVEAKEIFERIGNLSMNASASLGLGIIYKEMGLFEEAEATYQKAFAIDMAIGNRGGLVNHTIGLLDLYPQVGNFSGFFEALEQIKPIVAEEARFPMVTLELYPLLAYLPLEAFIKIQQHTAAVLQIQETPIPVLPLALLAVTALSYIRTGDLETGREFLAKLPSAAGQGSFLDLVKHLLPEVNTELALLTGEKLVETKAGIEEQIAYARKSGGQRYLPPKLLLLGRLLRAEGREVEARTALREARELATIQKARPLLWRICGQLAEIEEAQGNGQAANDLYREARIAVDFIADHAGSEELRTMFLASERVQAVLGKTTNH